jgi:hypothetical protein
MSQTVTSIRRTRPALSVEEVALREAERVAKSPDQLQMELANGQGNGAA